VSADSWAVGVIEFVPEGKVLSVVVFESRVVDGVMSCTLNEVMAQEINLIMY